MVARKILAGGVVQAVLLFVLVVGVSVAQAPGTPEGISAAGSDLETQWNIQCVDCPKRFSDMDDRSLQLDAGGHPHIAYGGEHLYYARHNGTTWYLETVDDSPDVGQYASLALDADGNPHISYLDYTNYDLKYAYWTGSDWNIQTVDSTGDVGKFTSLALDANDSPHISYYDVANRDLKYAVGEDLAPVQLDSVSVNGPITGTIGILQTFAVTTSPPTATMPIAYTWSPAPYSGQDTAQATYTWATAGFKSLTVTAANAVSEVSTTHEITITDSGVTYTLTVDTVGSGSVLRDPPGGVYAEGTSVTLTAVPDSGWLFTHWSGDASGTQNPITVTVSDPTQVSAHFVEVECTIYLPLTLRY